MAKSTEPAEAGATDQTPAKPDGGAGKQKPEDARLAAGEGSPQARGAPAGRVISERKGQFLITPRQAPGLMAMGLAPLQFSVVEQSLRANPDIEIVDTVGPRNVVGTLADGSGGAGGVLVARMTEQKAATLHQQAQGRLIVERDQPLALLDPAVKAPLMVSNAAPTAGPAMKADFIVLGKDNLPLKDAEVYLFGSMLPGTGTTDDKGQVTLTMYGESPRSIRALYVKPKSDYWTFYQVQPDISTDEPNIVGLRALSDWAPLSGMPQRQLFGWGQKAMRLDQLPANYRGQGVKIAIIDSGAATTHDDLKQIALGFDVINKNTNPDTWNEDTVAHGSHCAGVIAGADNGTGVRGFAPDAEIHVCKLFPGGQISQLIDALEYCIEKQIDVANLSLGGAEPSEALEQQIQRAARAGVACIVAAGNSGGRVQYPASSPNVLAVAAIGHISEFPPDSYHSQTVSQTIDANGFFSATFTCFGPEVAVCAPGVAIVSSVPANNFAAWDGTSMAAPHITGLAALALAHHPDFQGPFRARGAERVQRLFQLIKASARPLAFGDPGRAGYGLPDVLVAVGLQAPMGISMHPAAFIGMPAAGGIHPYSLNPYSQAELQRQWSGFGAWPQGGSQQTGSILNPSGFDPATGLFQQPGNLQGNPFGISAAFMRQGW